MKHQKPLIRRTFLQERFIILMELQQKGIATFADLTELDELINRDPKLRGIILEEMEDTDTHIDTSDKNTIHIHEVKRRGLLDKLSSFIGRLLHFRRSFSSALYLSH